jgi:hypothetical protein
MDRSLSRRVTLGSSAMRGLLLAAGLALVAARTTALASEPCGTGTYPFPYTDVGSVTDPFCPGIMEAYVTGVSKGTTGNTFSPNDTVSRLQMTTFLQRSLDQGLTRASRRTVFKQLWQTNLIPLTLTLTDQPVFCAADGETVWVAAHGEVDQIQASSGKILGKWTGPTTSWPIAAIPGFIITADNGAGSGLYAINPAAPPGAIGAGYAALPGGASSIAYDGTNIFIANFSGSVTIDSGGIFNTYNTGFNKPVGLVYDGTQMWVTDYGAGTLLPITPSGAIGTAVTVGAGPEQPAFDGENIWVPNFLDSSITVVQASTGKVVATIVSDGTNMLSGPEQASFDGERVLVTNKTGKSFTVFKAADLSVIATQVFLQPPYGVCSDGSHFWVAFMGAQALVQF